MMIRCVAVVICGLLLHSVAGSYGQSIQIDTVAANHHFNRGIAYTKQGNASRSSELIDSARIQFNYAAESYLQQDFWDRFFESARQIGGLYNHEHKYPEAKAYLDSVELNFGNNANLEHKSLIQYYGTIAYANLQLKNFILADAWFNKILVVLDQSPHAKPQNYLWTYYYLGVLYFRIGQNDLSMKYMDITENLGDKNGDRSYHGKIYNIKGIISRRTGEYEKALEYYTIGYGLQSHQPKVQLTPFLNNLAWLYHHLGNDSLALYYVNDGLQALEEYSDDYYSVESALRNTKARILIDQKNFGEADKMLSKNLEREFDNYGEYGRYSLETKINFGLLQSEQNNYESSVKNYEEALVVINKVYGEHSPLSGDVYRQVANSMMGLKKFDEALDNYQHAMTLLTTNFDNSSHFHNPEINDDIVDKLSLLKVLQDKSSAFLTIYEDTNDTKDLEGAVDANLVGIKLLDNVRQNLYYGESKQVLSGLMKPIFEQSIQLALKGLANAPEDQEYLDRIFFAMEGSKSYVLSSALQESNKEGSSILSDSLQRKQELLFLKTEYLSEKQNDLRAKYETDSAVLKEIKQELFTARENYQNFKDDIAERYPKYSQAKFGGNRRDLAEVQDYLRDDNLIVEYFAGKNLLYALAISSDKANIYELGSYKDIEDQVVKFSKFSISTLPEDYQEGAYELYRRILNPIMKDFNKDILTIIPDGVLGYVPFDALVVEKVEKPSLLNLKYGINEYSVSQHYLASLFINDSKEANSGTFIGYAPDFAGEQTSLLATRSSKDSVISGQLVRLPFARSEVEAASSLFSGEAIIGEQASEGHFKSRAVKYRYLHVASHSVVDNEKPLFSKLVFAKDEADTLEDGLLHAYELYSMRIQSDLVALSACNTGVGQFKNGEGIISLARGFIYAGASSVLMSLWEVADESTSIIMESFYQKIADGQEESTALQEAKLDYLKHADNLTANPYYWAGFTFLGAQPEKQNSSYWPYLVIFVVITYAAIRRRRRRGSV